MRIWRGCTLVALGVLALASVGETRVRPMGSGTAMAHSQAHVMGLMCSGGGRGQVPGDRSPEGPQLGPQASVWILVGKRTGATIAQYGSKLPCEVEATFLNAKVRGSNRYECRAGR